jgi:hypothetical protein
LPKSNLLALNSAIATLYNQGNLATQWFNKTLSTYGFTATQTLFNSFLLAGGFQRFSDANISYVNQNDTTGIINIGLAGHFDAATLLGLSPNPNNPLQASELVKVTYDGATPTFLYSYKATSSGLDSNNVNSSHNGIYEVTIPGVAPAILTQSSAVISLAPLNQSPTLVFQSSPPAILPPTPATTPEPSVFLSVLGVAGIVAAQRHLKKVAA